MNILRLGIWLLKGRAAFKNAVAQNASIDAAQLPYNEPLIAYLRNEKATGRRIIMATAAHYSIANRVACHLGFFDDVIASDASRNLKGKTKLTAIREQVGEEFVYAGDSRADVPIWKESQAAILVGVSPELAVSIRKIVAIEREFAKESHTLANWLRAFRIHQWLKNLLIFVPLLTAFSFTDTARLTATVVAFCSFSLAASATYILNDLWDLENDRAHPRKRLRPFASANIPILYGIAAAGSILTVAIILALAVSNGFLLMLLLYITMTSGYSWLLKEYVLIDVIVLSLLYTLRILAGSVASGIAASSWLLAFSVFVFLSLALVKRCSELISLERVQKEATRGRDYRVSDLVVLWPLGIGASLSAAVVFGLFISAPETQARYATPQLLWFVAVGLIYWLARLWIKTARGEMDDDPLIFAIKDHGSRITLLCMLGTVMAARFLTIVAPL